MTPGLDTGQHNHRQENEVHNINRQALRAAVLDRGHLYALGWVALLGLLGYMLGAGLLVAAAGFTGWALVTGAGVIPFLYGLDVDRQERRADERRHQARLAEAQLERDLRDELREQEDAILRADHDRVMQAIREGGDTSPSVEAEAILERRKAELQRVCDEAREARRARLAAAGRTV